MKRIQKKTWKNIKVNVKKYVKNCPTCAIRKHDRSPKKNYTSFYNHQKKIQRPALNFVIGLPVSQNPTTGIYYDIICTIIDGLTKYAKFIPCRTTMTAEKLTRLFLGKKNRITAFLNKSLMTEINCSRQNSIQNYKKRWE